MAYDKYKDQNGVTWRVITSGNGYTMIGTVLDDADPKYDPPAEDQQASLPLNPSALEVQNKTIISPDPPTAEQTRVIFIELIKKIEAYAASHRPLLMLKVTARPPWGALAAVAAGLWFLYEHDKRRRRRR